MIEFWHDFLYDKAIFGATVFLLFCVTVVFVMVYFMIKEGK